MTTTDAAKPVAEHKRWEKERVQAFASPKSDEAKSFADYSYKSGWALYFHFTQGKGETDSLEYCYRMLLAAAWVFEQRGDDFEEAKARQALSIVSGMLGR